MAHPTVGLVDRDTGSFGSLLFCVVGKGHRQLRYCARGHECSGFVMSPVR